MFSDSNSEGSGTGMTRVFSLSALENLLSEPDQKLLLREALSSKPEESRPKYDARHLQTPVVVVSSEVNPWSKTGGLAMVAGSYGYEFAMRGHRTMVVSPRYGDYEKMSCVGSSQVWLDGREHEVKYWHQVQDYGQGRSADYIFVEHISYRRESGLYWNPKENREYGDNLFRFALLCLAAMEAPLILNLQGSCYGQDVLFVANDWQAALVPVYLVYKYRRNNTYKNARCIYMIHNMGYQGKYQLSKFPVDSHLGLPPEAEGDLQGEDLNLGLDCLNLVSAALKLSDRVLTVSPNYALEIQSPEGGQGLHDILKAKGAHLRLGGILNGISDEWNPANDPHIHTNFTEVTFQEGKAKCKAALQQRLGLHQDPNVAMLGFCGRLCFQKGVQLITAIIPWLMHDDGGGVLGRVQLVLMGKGDEKYAAQLNEAENNYKGRICGYVGFDPRVEHQMMAGCDFLLMPSQYEPCGLPQMYAQAYATLPIVHETGGLKDSVKGLWDEGRDRSTATGFLFAGFDENHLKERLYQALEVFHRKKDVMLQMQRSALAENYYWPQAMDKYEEHIDWTLEGEVARG
jgi:starch synthase